MSMGIQEDGVWGVGSSLYRHSQASMGGSWLVG